MTPNNLEAGQMVNKVGKFIYKHIDNAQKIKFSPNMCDIHFIMYYQVPGRSDTFDEMEFDINITTYQNKLRINTTEMDIMEKTIGQDIYKPEQLSNLDDKTFKMIYDKIKNHIDKEYKNYDFVY